MRSVQDPDGLGEQYKDSTRLQARVGIHEKYGPGGWPEWIAQKMQLQPGSTVLDIGCGAAWFWEQAEAAFPDDLNIMLADQSEGMIAEAGARMSRIGRWPSVDMVVADVCSMPFDDGAFDAVIALHMIYHASDYEKAVSEIARVLKPGGRAFVTTNGERSFLEVNRVAAEVFGDRAFTSSDLGFCIEQAGPMLRRHFDDVTYFDRSGVLNCTDGADIVNFITSFPPGSAASVEERIALGEVVDGHMRAGKGVFPITQAIGLFVCEKAS